MPGCGAGPRGRGKGRVPGWANESEEATETGVSPESRCAGPPGWAGDSGHRGGWDPEPGPRWARFKFTGRAHPSEGPSLSPGSPGQGGP